MTGTRSTDYAGAYHLPAGALLVRDRDPPLCLYVPHGRDLKLVGKLLRHDRHGPVLLHEHGTTQRHHNTNCPAPLDVALVTLLAGWGVAYLYCYERPTQLLRRITVAGALDSPQAAYDDRLRCYPEESQWDSRTRVSVGRVGGCRVLLRGSFILRDVRTERARIV